VIRALIVISIAVVTIAAYADDGDSAFVLKPQIAQYDYDAVPKDPFASCALSATLPGTGQIYNREYGRGLVTAAGFYGCLYLAQYLYGRFELFNTDTVYFAETTRQGTHTGVYRSVYVPKADADWKWPSDTEKYLTFSTAILTGGFYIWGLYDAYQGAKRYNQKLATAQAHKKFDVRLAYSPRSQNFGFTAGYRF